MRGDGEGSSTKGTGERIRQRDIGGRKNEPQNPKEGKMGGGKSSSDFPLTRKEPGKMTGNGTQEGLKIPGNRVRKREVSGLATR